MSRTTKSRRTTRRHIDKREETHGRAALRKVASWLISASQPASQVSCPPLTSRGRITDLPLLSTYLQLEGDQLSRKREVGNSRNTSPVSTRKRKGEGYHLQILTRIKCDMRLQMTALGELRSGE
jgi:hypothetical protein